jgi:HAD superfamily hydrolase (TIGR01509 family)
MMDVPAAPAAVVFDMDGVLIDSGAHHRASWRALCADIGVEPPHEFWRLTIGRPAEEAVQMLLGRPMSPAEASALGRRKRAHYARLAGRGIMAIPGVAAYVAGLAQRGVPRAVATSAPRADLERLLPAIGLRGYFEVVVTAEDVRLGKPDPEVYVRAARGLGLSPCACLVFEDAPVGVQAARGAGMRVIGVTTAHTAEELLAAGAEHTIPHFEGLSWPA